MERTEWIPARITAIYLAVGVAWILLSDEVLLRLVRDPERLTWLQTFKGWFFVAMTGALLFALLRRALGRLRRAEAQAGQQQRMLAMGRMAAGVAHDFNNLLTVIDATAELARQGLPAGHPQAQALEEIRRAGQRGHGLVRMMLMFAQQQPSSPKVVQVAELLRACEPLLRKLVKPSVDLRLAAAADAGWVRLDPVQFDQVLMNLVINADAAMPQGGRVVVEAVADGGRVALRVEDNGQGVDPRDLPHVFEPFFTTKPADQGTGLGLATVYGIVQQYQGSIQVESRLGQGTVFRLRLPRDVPPAGPS